MELIQALLLLYLWRLETMGEWKTYTETIEEYNAKIDEFYAKLEKEKLTPPEKASLHRQIAIMVRSVAQMQPYAEREREKVNQ